MSVFTTVSTPELASWLKRYALGELVELKGIAAGTTNTNYAVTTTQGQYVLTLFEALQTHELPFYVNLMAHLAHHGVACAAPIANQRDEMIDTICGRPTVLVGWLPGEPVEQANAAQCFALGAMLAQMHRAGETYPGHMANPRGPAWWNVVAPALYPYLSDDDAAMLKAEVGQQSRARFTHLPSGVIHADLFRDNVLMHGDRIGGFIDFYYACNDILIYDLAITVNDWCAQPDGEIEPELAQALCAGYQSARPLSEAEREAWPLMLRAAALRFWVSRLWDWHKPPVGELTYRRDPMTFQHILNTHQRRGEAAHWL
ncbi:homoserine kinase [Chitinimonas sp. BJB300]|uniref:homoserine kinase n=1 Tax=Chitinimonas sp. BJB300 TaxID=1559339 RepID=UPI000C0F9E1D|nr:homoserine kinase [Chitinimonas sp. BJB300]PHV12742.1 homoserine kinase [Chitinimonas sp. BJB300]TSJ90921.1 homoserine kinase [Chitinimonas sp. BJB300]